MSTPTFYWHDYETWGRDPAFDRPAQFAGLRTDADLNVIGEPLVLFSRPADDMLPEPEACLITGITPQRALAEGVPESEFIERIHEELARPGTCGVGYNSLRFDDEFTRYTLYRNLLDPYAREWQNGNSRWDLIDTVRLAAAVRPEGLNWPTRDDGTPSFRLEDLTAANGIEHAGAHDALADVHATIALARRLREAQPRLFEYVLRHRDKASVAAALNPRRSEPVLHVSGKYPAATYCSALVLPLAPHPTNRNAIIVVDLSTDPEPLLSLDADAIRERVFTARADLPEGTERIPLKSVAINRAPVVVPATVLDAAAAERTGIDPDVATANAERLRAAPTLSDKVRAVFADPGFASPTDPDAMLYSGGFFSDRDRATMTRIRALPPADLARQSFDFEDPRLETLLFRFRARNYPDSLDAGERARWEQYRLERLTAPDRADAIHLTRFRQILAERRATADADQQAVLAALEDWGRQLVPTAVWEAARPEAADA